MVPLILTNITHYSHRMYARNTEKRSNTGTPELLPWQLQGPHIGCLVILRVYESHDVLGKVTHYCPPNDRDHALWRVRSVRARSARI